MATRLVQLNTVLAPKVTVGLGGDGGGNLLMVELTLIGKPIGDFSIAEIEALAKTELKKVAANA